MTETRLACYLYCVAPAAELPTLVGLGGVDGSFDVESVREDELSAVISRVPAHEFTAEALKRKLEDLTWLERTARAHDAVLARVLAGSAVVPLRLCTIFDDEDGVRDVLRREREPLLAALRRVRGHAEWSVKVLADPHALRAAVRERGSAPVGVGAQEAGAEAQAAGRAFFARKKLERAARDDARVMIERVAEEIHATLRDQAAAATTLPPQDRQLSGRSGEMILNGAYLVEHANAAGFAALATELGRRHQEIGLDVELSGPFAPYNFVPSGNQAK
jgi:Gas vesicle synthesis protein GvpL/GvpF